MGNYGDFNLKKYLYYFLIFILISLFIFVILYFVFSQNSELNLLISFSIESIITLITLLVIYYSLDGLRLHYILSSLDYKLDIKNMYFVVFLKYFISNVTPFSSGGGLAQIYYIQDTGAEAGKSTAAVVLRTVISTSILFITAPLIVISNGDFFFASESHYIIYYLLFLILYIIFLYTIIYKKRFLKKLVLRVLNFIKRKKFLSSNKCRKILRYLFKDLDLFSRDVIDFIKNDKKSLLITIFITFIFLTVEYSFSFFLLRALGYYQIAYLNVVFLHAVIAFIMYFTPTPGAAGGAEAGFIMFYRQLVDKNDIIALLFFWRFFTKYLGIFIGMMVFIYLVITDRREKN